MRPLVSTGCPPPFISHQATSRREVAGPCVPSFRRAALHPLFLTRPPHDVRWWVHASPRFGGPPFVLVLTRPPHNVGWWKVDVLTGDPKNETGHLRLGTVEAQAYCL